ncbi:glycosyltransferase family 4 protein [Marinobacter pelagius]|uniref:glycosyltransferase family 4 protein n=1 Tax=Marinobacter sp. C7 TaxID=2951363 RepID=UPI001EF05FA8|nr:glycosyltransferase family 1 protein [Marinobacter sp. C7]MCG7199137.1 glycosyltransferase family 4 protein [Marinobacter sp. C7]
MSSRLLIGLDSLAAPRTGIGYYTEHLISELMASEREYRIEGVFQGRLLDAQAMSALIDQPESIGPSGNPDEGGGNSLKRRLISGLKPVIRSIPGAYQARQYVRNVRFRRGLGGIENCLYHEPNYIPLEIPCPTVLTVHDMSHLRHPEYHPRERVAYLDKYLPGAVRSASHIITVSEFTRRELCHFFPEAEGKTTAIHLGVDDIFRTRGAAETKQVLADWGLEHGGYIFSAATLEPRKNLAGLVRAYSSLPSALKRAFPLVLAGGEGWKNHELKSLLARQDNKDHRIILTGRLPRSSLATLMSGARLFVYPSFYEGFGLPIAEARASGVPVMTSDRGATKEVAGKDALLIDPEDFGDALQEALDSEIRPVEVYRYSWADTARKTAEIYRRVFAGKA